MQGGEDEVAGEGGLNCNLCRLQIAGFADHDSIRVLPQKCSQYARESQPDVFIHQLMLDSFQILFHRLIFGHQFGIECVDLSQTRIKRRRFPRISRAGGNKNSVRPLNDLKKVIAYVLGHTEHLEIEVYGAAIEHAQNNALAKLRGQSRDAEIHAAAGDIFLDATILGQSALGDVHVRHHFHTRDYRWCQMSRRWGHFIQRAIDAITDFEFVFEWLEMNVAGPVLNCLIQNQIDKANDRSGIGFCFRSGRTIAFPQLHQLANFAELLEHFLHAGGVAAVENLDPVLDLFDRRLHDGLAVLLRFGQDVVSLRFLQYVLIDKKIEDLLVIHSSSAHIRNRYRDYFVGRGQTGKNFAHAVLTQSAHA